MRRFLVAVLLSLWPAAAVAASPVPVALYAEVDHALRPAVVLADPVSYRGRTLLLGGSVVRTVSEAGTVAIVVTAYRLGADDRPEAPDPSVGRIAATGAGLDGGQFQPGRLVTLVGRVTGWDSPAAARIAHVEIRFIHPWPTPAEEAAARQPAYSPGYGCNPWWYDPWCDPWYWGPYPYWRFGAGYEHHGH